MFTLTSNHNLKYEYAKALQVCDLLSNWVHPSQMLAFASKDKWRLEVSEKKKKGKKIDEEGYFEIFKGLRKIYILEVRVLYLLKTYLFFIVVLNIVNGNFRLVKSWQKSPRPIRANVLLVPFGPTLSHTLKPNWKGSKGQPN